MKKVVVTGATGFVGANLVRRLLRDGHDVHALVRKKHNNWRIREIQKEITLHTVEFANKPSLSKVFKTVHPDWIFHTAVYGAYSSQTNLDEMISTNIQGTANLLEAACSVGFDAFVNTGSSSEYGYKDHAPTEREALNPNSYYAISKAAATHLSQYTTELWRLKIPTLRLYSVYGAYEEPTRLIPTLLMHAMNDRLPTLVAPTIARDFVYIDDVVDAYMAAAKTKLKNLDEVINIATGVQTSIGELVVTTQKLFDVNAQPQWGSMDNRDFDATVWVGNASKAEKILRWKPKISLAQGLKKTYSWLEKNTELYKKSLSTS